MTVTVRFAPSPTGYLHIGGARTALFNWLFARHHGGRFLLRIEDTDRARSTQAAIDAILDGLTWLGLDWDDPPLYQSQRADRHREVAETLLAEGKAYRCYCTKEELAEMRETARAAGRPMRYDGRWRDRDPAEAPPGVAPVIRFKAPQGGETVIEDRVQGTVRVANDQLDDLILLRDDATPTYMLSVIVDDHDMGITHVIRGDDHLTNAFRQTAIFRALGWDVPVFAHIPLIHGPDGAKLSKRHGALGVEAYRELGILAPAMRNYLLRLGWGHGDDEIISTEQAIDWFDLDGVGKSPARFDMAKLINLNAHYLREESDADLVAEVTARHAPFGVPAATGEARLLRGMPGLKQRARTLEELAENAAFYTSGDQIEPNDKAAKLLTPEARARLAGLVPRLEAAPDWTEAALEEIVRAAAEADGVKMGNIAQPLRAALTGSNVSPGIFEVMAILGRASCLARVGAAARAVDDEGAGHGN
ncbi:MAG: glutamate--tRNA ligase [Alphaproteobacteria bacterium]|nr:glutamate--tRNA ligase [Alphaproteobacteria bacterium]